MGFVSHAKSKSHGKSKLEAPSGSLAVVGIALLGANGVAALAACSADNSIVQGQSTGLSAAGATGATAGSATGGSAAAGLAAAGSGLSSAGAGSLAGSSGAGAGAASGTVGSAGMSSGTGAGGAGTTGATGTGAVGTGSSNGRSGAAGDDAGADATGEASAPCNTSPGMALQFEGTTPDLVQATIAKIPLGKASRTIELWAYFDGTSQSWVDEHGLFEYGKAAGDATYPGQGCHEFGLNSTNWAANQAEGMVHPYGNCDSVDNFFNLPAGTPKVGWIHLSFGYDMASNLFQFTINGSNQLALGTGVQASNRTHPQNQWQASAIWNSTMSPLSIGTTVEFRGPTGWQGKIDEFRVWSVRRTPDEIKANMNVMLRGNEPGLIAYYKFDEGKGTTIADSTGDPTNVATMMSATHPNWVVSDIPGPFTCAR
jgi:hypothetical protein